MRVLLLCSVTVAFVLRVAPAAQAQSGACSQPMLQGVWSATCTGFTDLSKLLPETPPGTMVPMSMISRGAIKADGTGTRTGSASVAGTVGQIEMQETFKINPDCTGEKTYIMKIPTLNLTLPGKATFVFIPGGVEFRMMLVNAGDVVTCKYQKMFNSTQF